MAKTYFQFILEYLTPQQKSQFESFKMQKAAREHTDHFFGEGNDVIHEPLMNHTADKSEVHKKIEQHLNQTIPHEDYKAGVATDKYGRKVKIGKLVQNQNLQKQFASDNTRAGSKIGSGFTMSFHRGTQVAGQTNPEPNKEHPKGHSWQDHSCKNIKNGGASEALPEEIKHGTVVAFAHDHTGREIYRATLQPYTRADKSKKTGNFEGYVSDNKHPRVYHVDAEYGVKKPEFTAHAQDAARRLSAKAPSIDSKGKPIKYHIHHAVYDESDRGETLNHNIEDKDIQKIIRDGDHESKELLANHEHGLQPKHIQELIDQTKDQNTWAKHHDKHFDINKMDPLHYGGKDHEKFGVPKVGSEEYERAKETSRLRSAHTIRGRLLLNKNSTPEQIHELVTKPYVIKDEGKKTVDGMHDAKHLNTSHIGSIYLNATTEGGSNVSRKTIDHILATWHKGQDPKEKSRWGLLHTSVLHGAIGHPNGGAPEHFEAAHKHILEDEKNNHHYVQDLAAAVLNHPRVPSHIVNAHINSTNDKIKGYALEAAKRLKLGI